jgi:hypothetical protein
MISTNGGKGLNPNFTSPKVCAREGISSKLYHQHNGTYKKVIILLLLLEGDFIQV